MKHIINLPPKQKLLLNDLEMKIKNARNSNDYVQVNFGRKNQFIKIAFSKDQTYTIGYNIWNMEFSVKTNIMIRQYPKTNNKLAEWALLTPTTNCETDGICGVRTDGSIVPSCTCSGYFNIRPVCTFISDVVVEKVGS